MLRLIFVRSAQGTVCKQLSRHTKIVFGQSGKHHANTRSVPVGAGMARSVLNDRQMPIEKNKKIIVIYAFWVLRLVQGHGLCDQPLTSNDLRVQTLEADSFSGHGAGAT